MNLIRAFIGRDLAVERRYRLNALIKGVSILFPLALFYYLGRYVGDPGYFSFVFVGLVFSRFFQFWMNAFTESIRQEQFWGTAELIFLSPRHPLSVVTASLSGKVLLLAAELAGYLLLGIFVFGAPVVFSPAFPALLCLHALMFAGLGLCAGSFILYFKRGDPVNWLVASAFDLLSGVYFSVAILPGPLQAVSRVLPTTGALASWRAALLPGGNGAALFPAGQFLWAAVFGALGVVSFLVAFRRVRIKGELGSY